MQTRAKMLSTCALVATAMAAACASTPNVNVKTQLAPQASFGSYHSFTVMSPRIGSGNPAAQDDPMLESSISNQAIRQEIRRQLEARGYRADGQNADLGIAFYAASRQGLDVRNVDYGYPFRPWWWRDRQEVTPITEGTVVIDVIDRHTNKLVWRGTGRSQLSDDTGQYSKYVTAAIDQVLAKLPASS